VSFKGDYAFKGVVSIFWMPHLGIGQPRRATLPQLPGPNGDDPTGMGLALEQVERVQLKRSVEQQLDIVHQQEVPVGTLIRNLSEDLPSLKLAVLLRDDGKSPPKLVPYRKDGRLGALRERLQERGLPAPGRADQKDQLGVERGDLLHGAL
jgi:hypothetical protein